VIYVEDADDVGVIVDRVADAVLAAPGSPLSLEGLAQGDAHSARLFAERAANELETGPCYGFGLAGREAGGLPFPALFLGAVGGAALSHLPGLPLVYGVAMGIGAMCVVMLRLTLTSVLLATLLLSSDGLQVMPLAVVAVVVAYVASARLTPSPARAPPRPAEAAAAPPVRPKDRAAES
jgi:hypothetical protein